MNNITTKITDPSYEHLLTIATQREHIKRLENNSFDSPDGEIELIDNIKAMFEKKKTQE